MRKKCSNFIFRKVSKFKYLAHKTMFLLEIKSVRKGYLYLNCLMYRHLKCLIYMLRCFRLIFISFFVIFNPTRKLLVCFIIIMSLSLSWVLLVLLCDFNIDSIAQNQRTIHLKTVQIIILPVDWMRKITVKCTSILIKKMAREKLCKQDTISYTVKNRYF